MSEPSAALEGALLAHAHKLAEEYLEDARTVERQILDDSTQQLRSDEERQVLAAKARAERLYQQRMQAAELELRGEFERTAWSLIVAVVAALPGRLIALAQDEARYLPMLGRWLREGAQAIEDERLIVRANGRDLTLLRREWPHLSDHAAGKTVQLSADPIDSLGGVLVSSADDRIRVDNTFEARLERLDEQIRREVFRVLIASEYAQALR